VKLLSFSPPTIDSLSGCGVLPNGNVFNCSRLGGDRLTINGANCKLHPAPAPPAVCVVSNLDSVSQSVRSARARSSVPWSART
jgi:hypothetical protein